MAAAAVVVVDPVGHAAVAVVAVATAAADAVAVAAVTEAAAVVEAVVLDRQTSTGYLERDTRLFIGVVHPKPLFSDQL